MKKMKTKILALLCVAFMIFNLFAVTLTVSAAANDTAMTFTSGFDSLFFAEKKVTALPQTFEAKIKVPKSAGDQYWGDILAWNNDKSAYDGILLDLQDASGKVDLRFLCMKRTGASPKSITLRFPAALESYRGKDVHIAVTVDKANSTVDLYINGQKWTGTPTGATEKDFVDLYKTIDVNTLPYFTIGGDFREMIPQGSVTPWYSVWGVDNYRFFRGGIYSVAAFGDVRTDEEILVDKDGVSNTASGLMMSYDTSKVTQNGVMADLSGNGYDLKGKSIWFSDRSALGEYAYSFAVVGDTQVVARDESVTTAGTYSFHFTGNFNKIFNYIVDNKEEKNIQFAFHMGDITDWNNDAEWTTAMNAINKMNGVLPYNLIRGNHDGSDKFVKNYTTQNFVSNVADGEEYGFFDPENTLNAYQTLTVGKVKYLMLSLDLGPCKAVIDWANKVVEDHPNHNVIISTHSYLHRSGVFMDDPIDCSATQYNPGGKYNGGSYKENGNSVYWDFRLQKYKDGGEDYLYQDASYMWNNLVKKHENICMVLCGHDCSDLILKVEAEGDHGNKIVQLLIDAQDVDRRLQGAGLGHAGLIAMLYFSEDGKTVSTEYYSTIREQYFMTDNIYTFNLDLVDTEENDDNNNDQTPENTDNNNGEDPENTNNTDDTNNTNDNVNGENTDNNTENTQGGEQNTDNGNQNTDDSQNTDNSIQNTVPQVTDPTNPTDPQPDATTAPPAQTSGFGCGMSISAGAVSIVALSALGVCLVPRKKRK